MSIQKASYRQIMKATSLFGGVQVFNIFISIIRSKFVAILLGPEGMGIVGLFNSSTGMVAGLTNFGLGTSAVKDIAAANSTDNKERISTVINVYRRLVWLTGLLGTLVTLFMAPVLSRLTFGNDEFTISFVWLSATLLFLQLSSGQLVILQGLRKLKFLAKVNLIGSVIGLFITIPFYYFFGKEGIVPVIIGASLTTVILSWFYSRKIDISIKKLIGLNFFLKVKEC